MKYIYVISSIGAPFFYSCRPNESIVKVDVSKLEEIMIDPRKELLCQWILSRKYILKLETKADNLNRNIPDLFVNDLLFVADNESSKSINVFT